LNAPSLPDVEEATVSFAVPRDAVRKHFMRRLLLRPWQVVLLCLCIVSGAVALRYGGDFIYAFVFTFIAAVLIPIRALWLTNKLLDTNPVFTEQRTLTFRRSGYTVVHPQGRTDSAWDRYAGLLEDDHFFYLRIRGSRLDILLPKSAFREEQMVLFRRCVTQRPT
jgi:hypothetical protein